MLVSVILAAGKGTRMRSDLPKALQLLLRAPLLEHVLENLEPLSPSQTAVVVGYGRDQIFQTFREKRHNDPQDGDQKTGESKDRKIVWAVQDEQLGTAHAAHCGVEALASFLEKERDADVLILNGDLPLLRAETLRGLLERHRETRADVTILTCEKSDPTGYGRIIRRATSASDGSRALCGIVEENDADEATKSNREINVGTYVFRASAFRECYKHIDRNNAQGEYYLTDVVVRAAKDGRVISTFPVSDEREVAQVNSRSDMASAAAMLRQMLLEEYMAAGVAVDDPSSTYIEKGVRIGRGTRILPFTMIERGVEIGQRCEVGPFTHLRPGTRVADGVSIGNFVEIKNSRLGRNTKVRHLSYVGDGIVGESVNIGAGTILANYDGKVKNVTVIKDKAFIGSGTVLVAPVTVGEGAMTGAGSVVLKNQNVPDGEVVVGVPAKILQKLPKSPKG